MVTRRAVIRIQDWLLWREFHSSPDYSSLFGCELKTTTQWFTLQSLQPQPGTLHLKRFLKQKQKICGFCPTMPLGQFLTHKTKNTPKNHCNIPRFQSPLCTKHSDTDWAHSITTSLMPGLAESSIYFSLAFPSARRHTAGSPAP